jgi:hypothetical protein
MERNPAERYPSAAAMKAELDDYEKVELVERFRRLQPPQLWKSRFRLLPLILLFVLCQIVGFFLIIWYIKHHGKK